MTYGRVARSGGQWVIDATPSVRMRLKRVFERAEKRGRYIVLTDTAEVGRELTWFFDRFPMDIEDDDRVHLAHRAAEHRAREEMVGELLRAGFEPRAFEMALPPRTYQSVAAELVLRSGSLLLADDVGLGKTASAICVLTDPRTRPALVVTLTHLPSQWCAELTKFAPSLRVHVIKQGRPYAIVKKHAPFPDVLIINYAKVAGWSDVLAGAVKCVILDEAQEVRRTGPPQKPSQKYWSVRQIAEAAEFRMGLTATPIYNYGHEMFNVLECLRPGVLGTKHEFEREWCGGNAELVGEPRALGSYLREEGLMLRRTRRDVGRELPACNRIPYEVDADARALDAVKSTAGALARMILGQGPSLKGEKFKAAGQLDYMLRQATGIAKAPAVIAFVRMLIESGERVVLYGWHHAVYNLWRDAFKDITPAFFTGNESPRQKDVEKLRFMKGQTPLMIMSLRAGAGLDGLQDVCRTVVFGELDWSPGVHEQNIGRVYRDGQQDPVAAYFMIADCGADPVIVDVLGLKKQQAEGIRDPDAELTEKLTIDPDHIRRLAAAYLEQQGEAIGPARQDDAVQVDMRAAVAAR